MPVAFVLTSSKPQWKNLLYFLQTSKFRYRLLRQETILILIVHSTSLTVLIDVHPKRPALSLHKIIS
jgi:hypothetical protein